MPTKQTHNRVVDPSSSSNKNTPEEPTKKIQTTNHPVAVKVKQTRRQQTKLSPSSPHTSTIAKPTPLNELRLTTSLQILNPLLQFITHATGRNSVPLQSLRGILPSNKHQFLLDVPALCARGVLYIHIHVDRSLTCHETTGGCGVHNYKYTS